MESMQSFIMPDPVICKEIAKQNNVALKRYFRDKIKGNFLLQIKERALVELGFDNFIKYFNFSWSNERMITGIGDDTAEYDICRMIVGIHKAHSVFLTDNERREKEKNEKYKQQIVSEVIEKIKLRQYGSSFFRKKTLLQGEEFLFYPLPYELFTLCIKMGFMLNNSTSIKCISIYFGIIHNGLSALSLLEDNLLGGAYPLCRGSIEMYVKLLLLSKHIGIYEWYERFSRYEVEQSCCSKEYPNEFNRVYEERTCKNTTSKADYLHFGWVDFIDDYHDIVRSMPYSIYGVFKYLKDTENEKITELERLKELYKSCHAYTHGSTQISKYPVLHYFEISIMLYYTLRSTYLLLCGQLNEPPLIDGMDVITMVDRDFDEMYGQYRIRSTERFEEYYNSR